MAPGMLGITCSMHVPLPTVEVIKKPDDKYEEKKTKVERKQTQVTTG